MHNLIYCILHHSNINNPKQIFLLKINMVNSNNLNKDNQIILKPFNNIINNNNNII